MFDLEIKAFMPKVLENLNKIIRSSSYFAQKDVGNAISSEISECVESSGYGKWPGIREITRLWRRGTGGKPLSFLSVFSRYFITGEKLSVGFLPGSKVGGKFLDRYVESQQRGFSIPVSSRMRGKFAAKGFPLKSGTKKLEVPARSIVPLAFRKIEPEVGSIFEKGWYKNFESSLK